MDFNLLEIVYYTYLYCNMRFSLRHNRKAHATETWNNNRLRSTCRNRVTHSIIYSFLRRLTSISVPIKETSLLKFLNLTIQLDTNPKVN